MDYARQFDSPRKGSQGPERTHAASAAAPAPAPSPTPPWAETTAAAREPVCTPERDRETPVPRFAPAHSSPTHTPPHLVPPPVQRSRCRTAVVVIFRVVVTVFALAMVALTVAGQLLPFCQEASAREEVEYAVWQERTTERRRPGGAAVTEREEREDNAVEKAFAVLSAGLSLIAFILCCVFVGLWARHERERRREAEAYAQARRRREVELEHRQRGHISDNAHVRVPADRTHRVHHVEADTQDSFKRDASSSYPHAFGGTEELYRRERRRRRVDRDVGISAFALLMGAAASSLVTIILMARFYLAEIVDGVEARKGETSDYLVGFWLFIAALATGVVAFFLLALPFATDLYLCCGPKVKTPKTAPGSSSRSPSEVNEEARRGIRPVPTPAAAARYNINNNNNAPAGGSASPPPTSDTQVHRNVRGSAQPDPRATDTSVNTRAHPRPSTGPQPYVPTMVGTYPEALPGPTSMEHVTMHHVPEHHGGANGAAQAGWGEAGVAPGQPIGSAQQDSRVAHGGYGSGAFYTSSS